MEDKFNLHFEIIDRDAILTLRREYGLHMNPWNFYPRLITSMDFLKREQPTQFFIESLKSKRKVFLYEIGIFWCWMRHIMWLPPVKKIIFEILTEHGWRNGLWII